MPFLPLADGTLIYAEAVGDASKPVLVFIHGLALGLLGHHKSADPRWSEALYLVRYDTRGHGQSGMPTDAAAWESQRLAEDFDAVVNAFGLKNPFVLGWSLGATHIADVLAFHPPSYLSGIIHLAAVPYITEDAVAKPSSDAMKSLISNAGISFIDLCTDDASFELQAVCRGYVLAQPGPVAQLVLGRTQNVTGLLTAGEQGLPLLALAGTDDLALNGSISYTFMEPFKDKEFVSIEGADHMAWLTDKDLMRETIVAWIYKNVHRVV
ncbi:Alpha/Beta hydrolase protein [Mucidula mucida]|nr:Alpha/Beta hydrolase protein [Mucidula mucida]